MNSDKDRAQQLNDADGLSAGAAGLRRRRLLRGGAVLAGTLGMAAAAPAGVAQAADDDPLKIGNANDATNTTSLVINGSKGDADQATLALTNAAGPALNIPPTTLAAELQVGDISGGIGYGPEVGVETPAGSVTTYLATGLDLASMATPFPTAPFRILDLRTEAGRASIIRPAPEDALDTTGRLKAGQWIDIGIAPVDPDNFVLTAIFANLTAINVLDTGWASLYPPGVRPPTVTVNVGRGQVVANGTFVGLAVVNGYHAVRLFTVVRAHFVLDVTGGVASGFTTPLGADAAQLKKSQAKARQDRASGGRASLLSRVVKSIGASR